MATGPAASEVANTSSRLDAGSVLTSRTECPRSASATATAQEVEVFPTPPLPVKNRFRAGRSNTFIVRVLAAAALVRDGICGRGSCAEAQLLAELGTRGILALAHDLAVGNDERQAADAILFNRAFHRRILGERPRLVAQVVARDRNAALLEPFERGSKLRELVVRVGTAGTSGTALRRIINIYAAHGLS